MEPAEFVIRRLSDTMSMRRTSAHGEGAGCAVVRYRFGLWRKSIHAQIMQVGMPHLSTASSWEGIDPLQDKLCAWRGTSNGAF